MNSDANISIATELPFYFNVSNTSNVLFTDSKYQKSKNYLLNSLSAKTIAVKWQVDAMPTVQTVLDDFFHNRNTRFGFEVNIWTALITQLRDVLSIMGSMREFKLQSMVHKSNRIMQEHHYIMFCSFCAVVCVITISCILPIILEILFS